MKVAMLARGALTAVRTQVDTVTALVWLMRGRHLVDTQNECEAEKPTSQYVGLKSVTSFPHMRV
jgi:hypothetical protein